MNDAIRSALKRIGREVTERALAETGAPPAVEHDPEWLSECIVGEPASGRCHWRPTPMSTPPDFSGLANALECGVHDDLRTYFGSFWSANLPARRDGNDFELLQLWNGEDFDSLVANQIGHALEKRRIRQPLSFFFAETLKWFDQNQHNRSRKGVEVSMAWLT